MLCCQNLLPDCQQSSLRTREAGGLHVVGVKLVRGAMSCGGHGDGLGGGRLQPFQEWAAEGGDGNGGGKGEKICMMECLHALGCTHIGLSLMRVPFICCFPVCIPVQKHLVKLSKLQQDGNNA